MFSCFSVVNSLKGRKCYSNRKNCYYKMQIALRFDSRQGKLLASIQAWRRHRCTSQSLQIGYDCLPSNIKAYLYLISICLKKQRTSTRNRWLQWAERQMLSTCHWKEGEDAMRVALHKVFWGAPLQGSFLPQFGRIKAACLKVIIPVTSFILFSSC